MSLVEDLPIADAPPQIWSAMFAEDITSYDQLASVVIPALNSDMRWQNCPWENIITFSGNLPKRGDDCVICMDENDRVSVIAWQPADPGNLTGIDSVTFGPGGLDGSHGFFREIVNPLDNAAASITYFTNDNNTGTYASAELVLQVTSPDGNDIYIDMFSGNPGREPNTASINIASDNGSTAGGGLSIRNNNGVMELGFFTFADGGGPYLPHAQITGTPVAATDLATALTLLNFIRAALLPTTGYGLIKS